MLGSCPKRFVSGESTAFVAFACRGNTVEMAMNLDRFKNGIHYYAGEECVRFVDGIELKLRCQEHAFAGRKRGRLYLTTHACVFINQNIHESLRSLLMPFTAMTNVQLYMPLLGTRLLTGTLTPVSSVEAGFEHSVEFTLFFKDGGTLKFARDLYQAARRCSPAHLLFLKKQPFPDLDIVPAINPRAETKFAQELKGPLNKSEKLPDYYTHTHSSVNFDRPPAFGAVSATVGKSAGIRMRQHMCDSAASISFPVQHGDNQKWPIAGMDRNSEPPSYHEAMTLVRNLSVSCTKKSDGC